MTRGAEYGMDDELIRQTLDRFEAHRKGWQKNAAVRTLYREWYAAVAAQLPPRSLGRWVELGSGPGFARESIAELELSDIVRAPWHDHQIGAEALPFDPGSLGALVLVDVLHHLGRPAAFFAEAERVLAPGGRVILLEPLVTPLSYPVYRFLHREGCTLGVDALADAETAARDPFEGNQAMATVLFGRQRGRFEARFPRLHIREKRPLAGLSYPASGGFSRPPLLPLALWRTGLALERLFPQWLFGLCGFRLLVTLERTV